MDLLSLKNKINVWDAMNNHLHDNFDICGTFDLLYYDDKMSKLWHDLNLYKSFHFLPNQRLVFTYYDVDYFLYPMEIGFTIENLFRILDNLDISLEHCILLTNHHGLSTTIKRCARYSAIKVSENNFCPQTSPIVPIIDRCTNDIQYHFCFMSNVRRDHRSYVRLWLHEYNLESSTIMAWRSKGHRKNTYASQDINISNPINLPTNLTLVHTTPFTRMNDKLHVSHQLADLYRRHWQILDQDHIDPIITTLPNTDNYNAPWLRQIFVNLVAETVFDYPYPYITEKTFKCFWHRSPFILIGAAGSLKYLRSIGFRTFGTWIDESYDDIEDANDRMLHLFGEFERISNWSIDRCKIIYNEMQEVLMYNLNHYLQFFCKDFLQQKLLELTYH